MHIHLYHAHNSFLHIFILFYTCIYTPILFPYMPLSTNSSSQSNVTSLISPNGTVSKGEQYSTGKHRDRERKEYEWVLLVLQSLKAKDFVMPKDMGNNHGEEKGKESSEHVRYLELLNHYCEELFDPDCHMDHHISTPNRRIEHASLMSTAQVGQESSRTPITATEVYLTELRSCFAQPLNCLSLSTSCMVSSIPEKQKIQEMAAVTCTDHSSSDKMAAHYVG